MTALPRGTCRFCRQEVALRRDGTAREHVDAGSAERRTCRGSGEPAAESYPFRGTCRYCGASVPAFASGVLYRHSNTADEAWPPWIVCPGSAEPAVEVDRPLSSHLEDALRQRAEASP